MMMMVQNHDNEGKKYDQDYCLENDDHDKVCCSEEDVDDQLRVLGLFSLFTNNVFLLHTAIPLSPLLGKDQGKFREKLCQADTVQI